MQQWDRERSIKKETKIEDALEMIRMGRQNSIPDDKIRPSIIKLGIDEKDIDGLFKQIDDEEKDEK